MDIKHLNVYQRLRDFEVPAAVLDAIFEDQEDLDVLIKAWDSLKEDGLKGDEVARVVAEMIFKELDISLDLD